MCWAMRSWCENSAYSDILQEQSEVKLIDLIIHNELLISLY